LSAVSLAGLFDILLAVSLVVVALQVFASREHFTAVVLFITYGLLMALAFVRLRAPDVALAEAAVGAGLTGALLLDAVGRIARRGRGQGDRDRG
jgi:uncharacterized MnhB-related membrane protein